MRRVRLHDFDTRIIEAKSIGSDLRENRIRALAHLGAGREHTDPAFIRGFDRGYRREIILSRARESGAMKKRSEADAMLDLASRILPRKAFELGAVAAD